MLNAGSTSKPYEPYGYKIPISINNNIYSFYINEPIRKLGEYVDNVSFNGTVTKIVKKLVLTGQESWNIHSTIASWFYVDELFIPVLPTDTKSNIDMICSHYTIVPYYKANADTLVSGESTFGHPGGGSINRFIIKDTNYTTVADFQTYLQQQYDAGTPVTVWYVLTNTVTETFTAPIIPTINGNNIINIDTTLKPTKLEIEYVR
jgi:hypothetical protein